MEETTAADRIRSSPLPRVARFRFRLEAVDPLRLPPYSGSVWRGLLGNGLRRTACLTHQPVCDGCLLRHACVYSTLFESPAHDPAAARRYKELPHPFVLEISPATEGDIPPGQSTTLGINLIGQAIEQMPYLIHAMQLAGRKGAGQTRSRFTVAALDRERNLGGGDWLRVYEAEQGRYLPPGATDKPRTAIPARCGADTAWRHPCA